MAGFFLVGTPLIAVVWHALNDLIAGHVYPGRLAVAAGAALVLAGVLRLLSRSAQSLDGARYSGRPSSPARGDRPHA